MINDYLLLAYKNLRRRKLRSWLTLLGIVIGITAVVSLIGLGQGLQVAVSDLFGALGTDRMTIIAGSGMSLPGTSKVDPLTTENLENLRNIAGVNAGTGRIQESTEYEFNRKQRSATVVSVSIDDPEALRLFKDIIDAEASEGRMLGRGDNRRILLGSRFSQLEDFFGRDIRPGSRLEIENQTFEVIGILERKGNPSIDSAIYMPEEDMRSIFHLTRTELTSIILQVEDESRIDEIKEEVEQYLRRVRDVREGDEDFSIQTPEDAMENVNSTLGAINIFVYLIAGISIAVGGIGIMNTMFMSVTERTREIGIMKSIGARNDAIFSLFFIESGLLGAIGGLIGASLGSLISMAGASALQNFIGGGFDITAQISPLLFGGCVASSFFVGSLFGTLPAYRASLLNPVDALRKKK